MPTPNGTYALDADVAELPPQGKRDASHLVRLRVVLDDAQTVHGSEFVSVDADNYQLMGAYLAAVKALPVRFRLDTAWDEHLGDVACSLGFWDDFRSWLDQGGDLQTDIIEDFFHHTYEGFHMVGSWQAHGYRCGRTLLAWGEDGWPHCTYDSIEAFLEDLNGEWLKGGYGDDCRRSLGISEGGPWICDIWSDPGSFILRRAETPPQPNPEHLAASQAVECQPPADSRIVSEPVATLAAPVVPLAAAPCSRGGRRGTKPARQERAATPVEAQTAARNLLAALQVAEGAPPLISWTIGEEDPSGPARILHHTSWRPYLASQIGWIAEDLAAVHRAYGFPVDALLTPDAAQRHGIDRSAVLACAYLLLGHRQAAEGLALPFVRGEAGECWKVGQSFFICRTWDGRPRIFGPFESVENALKSHPDLAYNGSVLFTIYDDDITPDIRKAARARQQVAQGDASDPVSRRWSLGACIMFEGCSVAVEPLKE